ncbi:fungal hydrophobin [Panus rudis PR-1116 ss-1]|nr:fungal hydrophobin [Panus rudis PR-1116 ss-1]
MLARTYQTVVSVLFFVVLAVATPWGAPPPSTTKPPTTTTTTIVVTATPPASTPIPANSCSTGPIQCCNSVQQANSPGVSSLLGLLGIVLSGTNVLAGIGCSPISVIGVGGGNCKAQAVCCENNSFGSLISLGCVPVSL